MAATAETSFLKFRKILIERKHAICNILPLPTPGLLRGWSLKVAGRHRSVRVEEEIGFKPAPRDAPFTRSHPSRLECCFRPSNRYGLTAKETYPLGRGPAGLHPLSARASQPGPRAPQSRMERYHHLSFVSLRGKMGDHS